MRNPNMLTQLNHYQALGLSQSATEEEIKSAYKELALRYHPVSLGLSPDAYVTCII